MSAERWRLIDSGPGDAAMNMALDEALARCTIRSGGMPALRVYAWDRPSVTIGRFQRASELDTQYCIGNEIPLVRRPTGGRAILHGHELTYSFSVARGHRAFGGDLFQCYSEISRAFLEAFTSLGLRAEARECLRGRTGEGPLSSKNPLCFSSTSFGEITLKGRKIIGSAQRRWPGGMLQQGSIPLAVSNETAAGVFHDNGTHVLTGLREADASLGYEEIRDAIVRGFSRVFKAELAVDSPTGEEASLAMELKGNKYGSSGWNFLR